MRYPEYELVDVTSREINFTLLVSIYTHFNRSIFFVNQALNESQDDFEVLIEEGYVDGPISYKTDKGKEEVGFCISDDGEELIYEVVKSIND